VAQDDSQGEHEVLCGRKGCGADLAYRYRGIGSRLRSGFVKDQATSVYRLSRWVATEWERARAAGVSWRAFEPTRRHGRHGSTASRRRVNLTPSEKEDGFWGFERAVSVKCPLCGFINFVRPFKSPSEEEAEIDEE